ALSAGSDGDDRHGQERLFVAWEPDDATRDALARCAAAWRAREPGPGLRWQHGAQLHLTLRFLGATSPQQRIGIEAGVAAIAARRGPAGARSATLEAWPSPRAPRVLVLVLAPDAALAELAAALETLARDCGFPAENRRFRPHFTLARARPGTVLRAPAPAVARFACRIARLSLVRSTPTASGSRYDEVSAWALATP
ncbi:MAG TPA: RNA 2',3'-cyclic phosphodiesterase, partial [Xanthomonadales bacterium]|nr:RNA 2',3'-cyclic phosphodiesterase [Xanthomonadales bacterium]